MSTKPSNHRKEKHKQTNHTNHKEHRMEDQNTVLPTNTNTEPTTNKNMVIATVVATALLLIAGGVWLVTRKDTKQKTTTTVESGSQQYCEARSSVCWSYPKDWTMGSEEGENGENLSSVQVIEGQDSAKALKFTYTAPVIAAAGNADFMPYYVGDVTGSSDLKVVGGVYPSRENTPYFFVVDATAVKEVVSAKSMSFSSSPTFTNKGTTTQVQAMVAAEGTTFATPEAAKSFFGNDTASQARDLLQTISFKNR